MRSMILSSCLLILMKSTWRDPGTCLLVFSSWRSRLDEIQYLVFLSSRPDEVDLTRFRILSSCLLVLTKSTWRDPGSCLLVFSSWRSRLDEIQDRVFLSSHPHRVDSTRSRILSSRPDEVDLTRLRNLSFCLLASSSWLIFSSSRRAFSSSLPDLSRLLGALLSFRNIPKKSRRRDLESHLLAFLHPISREDEMPDLTFSASWTQEVELTRFRISPSRLGSAGRISPSRLLGPKKKRSRRRDTRSRLLAFLDPRSREDDRPDLAFSTSRTKSGREDEELSRHLGGTFN